MRQVLIESTVIGFDGPVYGIIPLTKRGSTAILLPASDGSIQLQRRSVSPDKYARTTLFDTEPVSGHFDSAAPQYTLPSPHLLDSDRATTADRKALQAAHEELRRTQEEILALEAEIRKAHLF